MVRSEEHTSELQSLRHLVCRLLLEKKKKKKNTHTHNTHNYQRSTVICSSTTLSGQLIRAQLPARLHLVYFYYVFFFFFNDTATTEIYTLSLHDALPICSRVFLFLRFNKPHKNVFHGR